MNNAITYAITRILTQVPRELLEKAFRRDPFYDGYSMTSIEDRIKYAVIDNVLRPELNIAGGEIVTIFFQQLPYREINNAWVYNVPLSMTQGRLITAIHSIEMGTSDFGPAGPLTDVILDAASGPSGTGTARVAVRGPNTIVSYEQIISTNAFMRCVLENDAQFQNLNPKFYREFGKLAVLATQMIIYNTLDISMGSASLVGGEISGQLRSRLDSYADSAELFYQEIETLWSRIFLLQDNVTKNRTLRLLISPV
jgi:hypothetical protein